jgi:sulfate adenylyltransferase
LPSTHASNDACALIAPFGGSLFDLRASAAEGEQLMQEATGLPSIQIAPRVLCDLELLAAGGLSPLSRFMNRADYRSVLESMRLADGTLFPIPITLPVASTEGLAGRIALRSPTNHLLAILEIEEIFEREPEMEARQIAGTLSESHNLVSEMRSWGRYCLSGRLQVLELPRHYDFAELRRTPAQVRELLGSMNRPNVVAYATNSVMGRSAEDFTKRTALDANASLLLQPVVGETKIGDIAHFARVQSAKALVDRYYDRANTLLNLLPWATRWSGPREEVLQAIVHRNYGANQVIVQPDAQEFLESFSKELGVTAIPFDAGGPESEMRPEVATIVARANPPRNQQGLCIWFTGLPSAGKSTIAEILAIHLMEHGRRVTMLDGDVVRTHLSKGLGFSREDRDVNIRRLGFVAGEIARHNGTSIVAAVSPFNSTRNQAREMVGDGRFVLVYVSTPAEVCEDRDVKGFYRKARAGELKHFTGVDDPYEPPPNPEIRLETVACTPEQNAQKVFDWLREHGYIGSHD